MQSRAREPNDEEVRRNVQEFDKRLIKAKISQLKNVAKGNYAKVVADLQAPNERVLVSWFVEILKAFPSNGQRKEQYALAHAMLAHLSLEPKTLVMRILRENIFDNSRLNAINRVEYYVGFEWTFLSGAAWLPQSDLR